ncbi:MAG: Lrp/AsnC family transcriptional regulator [Archaeoglobaceae archaeon]
MDEKDRLIIALLQENGRASYSDLGKNIGMTAMGVKKRVEKLLNKGEIKVKALINAEKLYLAILVMEVEDSNALNRIIDKFRECPRVLKFFVTTGSYNLFAIIFSEDFESLESITLESCSLRAQSGIKRYEVYPVQEIHYEPFLDIKVVAKKLDKPPCNALCMECRRYKSERCLGCPATKMYRGKL